MRVNLARGWFDPTGTFRSHHFNPHELPDEWEDQLPPGAVKLEEEPAPAAPKKGKTLEL